MTQSRKMLIGTTYAGPYGAHPGAWRTPWAKPDAYTDIEVAIRSAQIAERGGLDFVFYPDRVFIWGDLEQVGRSPDEVKFLSFVSFGLGQSKKDAVERRMVLEEAAGIENRLAQLSAVVGVRLDPRDCDRALTPAEISRLRSHPGMPRSGRVADLARLGLTPREILGHGVLDQTPGLVGTPDEAADMLQEWMETDASDGFILTPDDEHDSIEQFVDLVVPILRRRGLRTERYEGQTLRDHMGLSEQLGRDPRVSADIQ